MKNNNIPVVSIICNTYNHEKYIGDALDGFLMQKTSFPIEILVHDDASTDNTASIIREYEKKYPDIIKPIYETENQYSKNDGSLEKIQYGRVKGKYIALCEGDDFWIDPYKLQKQFDEMEKHPEIDMSAHAHLKVNASGDKLLEKTIRSRKKIILSPEQVIFGGGPFLGTASLFFRKQMHDNLLKFARDFHYDYTIQVSGSLRGGILYLPDIMSSYRWLTPGSWTERNLNNKGGYVNRKISILKSIDSETNYKYHNLIVANITYEDDFRNKPFFTRLKAYLVFRKYFKSTMIKDHIRLFLEVFFPFILKLKLYIKEKN